jgi:hypothetical protein
VWAAGNAIDPRAQVIASAGAGNAAAIAINTDLVQDDVDRAVSMQVHSDGSNKPSNSSLPLVTRP